LQALGTLGIVDRLLIGGLPFKKRICDGFSPLESANWLTLKKPGCELWLQAITSPEIRLLIIVSGTKRWG
jgi:hypothetical protein